MLIKSNPETTQKIVGIADVSGPAEQNDPNYDEDHRVFHDTYLSQLSRQECDTKNIQG
ncbi:MAG: hypothetical protein WCS73_08100 [Lentisphaeria bacterium]